MVDRLLYSELNTRRIASVESRFGSTGVPLSVPGRVLVGGGVLTKMCRKRPKTRQFFLFNDILVYGNILIGVEKYNKQHIMPLEQVSLESIADNQQYRNGWYIRTTTKSFVVYAATSAEKQQWMAHINKCVKDLLRKSGKKAMDNYAAVWVPDAEASICMNCKKTQFTFVQRRHHCRNCGAVVCAGCSTKKFLLPQQSSKSLRVCDACYDRLHHMPGTATYSDAISAAASAASVASAASTTASPATGKLNVSGAASADSCKDEDTASIAAEAHYEPRFYFDRNMSAHDASMGSMGSGGTTGNQLSGNHISNNWLKVL